MGVQALSQLLVFKKNVHFYLDIFFGDQISYGGVGRNHIMFTLFLLVPCFPFEKNFIFGQNSVRGVGFRAGMTFAIRNCISHPWCNFWLSIFDSNGLNLVQLVKKEKGM